MSDHKFKNELELTFWVVLTVLCCLSMRLGMATLFCCNVDSIIGEVGVSRESYTSAMGLGTPCSRISLLHVLVYGDF
jgi:hypothetical protein